jgi:integrase
MMPTYKRSKDKRDDDRWRGPGAKVKGRASATRLLEGAGQPVITNSTGTYRQAIHNACRRAGVAPWRPHQLRHNAATRLTEQFGWEIARVILGHESVETTRIYAADTYRNAARAMREIG